MKVVRVGDTVHRTWDSPYGDMAFVHELLDHLEGWPGAPRFLGFDEEGREVLTYLPGTHGPVTDASLVRATTLVRELHDLTAGTPLAGDQEVVCHNDLSPANTVFDGALPYGFIDWDLAAPGRRVHDVAHLCWQWLDLGPNIKDLAKTAERVRLIADTYGITSRTELLETVLWWQERCADGIERAGIDKLIEAGVPAQVRAAREWTGAHLRQLT
ncbi:phosphotransferase [Nonomuraea sp. NPDC050556]|uniref:phosphotransferase n=1 Tax=Nonomuraea sp. NPDC050556 TaxID=3364369 RepID=UPI0037B47CD5